MIVFICRGNTCRSALAVAYARACMARTGDHANVRVQSAGVSVTSETAGAAADPRAIEVGAQAGLELGAHRTQPVLPVFLAEATYLVALDQAVGDELARRICAAGGSATGRVVQLMDFAPELGVAEVADPYEGTIADYQHAFVLIRAGVNGLLRTLNLEQLRE